MESGNACAVYTDVYEGWQKRGTQDAFLGGKFTPLLSYIRPFIEQALQATMLLLIYTMHTILGLKIVSSVIGRRDGNDGAVACRNGDRARALHMFNIGTGTAAADVLDGRDLF